MEDRLGERMDEVLSHVRTSLSDTTVTTTAPPTLTNGKPLLYMLSLPIDEFAPPRVACLL